MENLKQTFKIVKRAVTSVNFFYSVTLSLLLVQLTARIQAAGKYSDIHLYNGFSVFNAAFFVVSCAIIYFIAKLLWKNILPPKSKYMAVIRRVLKSPLTKLLLCVVIFRLWFYPSMNEYVIFPDSESYINFPQFNSASRTPVYPLFIKLMGLFSGSDAAMYVNIVHVQQLFSLAAVVLFYLTLKKLFNNKYVVTVATLVFACNPYLISWDKCILTESLSIFSLVLLVYFMVSYIKKPGTKLAVTMGIYSFYLIMLRPTFLYVPVIMAAFWLFKFFSAKLERRQTIAGAIAVVASFAMTLGYCQYNLSVNGFYNVSTVGTYVNQLWTIIDNNYYNNPEYPEITSYVSSALSNGGTYSNVLDNIQGAFTYKELDNYVSSCFKQHSQEYSDYTVHKFKGIMPTRMEVMYVTVNDEGINNLKTDLENLTSPLTFSNVFILLGASLVFTAAVLIKRKKCAWPVLGLTALVFSHIVVSVFGAPYESQRLCVVVLPLVFILAFYYIDLFCNLINKKSLGKLLDIASE